MSERITVSTALEISSKPLIQPPSYTCALHCRVLPGRKIKWAACGRYLQLGKEWTQFGGTYADTTINQGYLMAAIELLGKWRHYGSRLKVISTHDYLIQAMASERYRWWEANNWIMTAGSPVKNADLWKRLATAAQQHASVRWVRPRTAAEHVLFNEAIGLSKE